MCPLNARLKTAGLLVCLLVVFLLPGLAGCGRSTGLAIGEENIAVDEGEITNEMIALIKAVSLRRRAADSQGLVRRFNQAKTIACAHGDMEVQALPEALAFGLFSSPGNYRVSLRFANATQMDDRDADLRGLSMRVMGVARAMGDGGKPAVQDFTLNSYPALFAGTPGDFLSFVKATAADRFWLYLLTHPKSLWIGLQARGHPDSPLAVDYFSTTPYRYGEGSAVKYAVRACDEPGSRVVADHADYLRDALQHDLSLASQCLNLQVQFQSDADLMPMEDASVIWPEDISPFINVAKITLPVQDVVNDAALNACEQMTFNPWNALPENRPLGGVNRVRQRLYRAIGQFRTQENAG